MKAFAITTLVVISFLGLLFLVFNNQKPQAPQTIVDSSPTPTVLDEKVNIQASFTMITGNITRSFKTEKYHNQSADVYIENPDPTTVYVKKKDITWDDFFKSLPMKLTKDCLITGDGETLCNQKQGSLKFFLNDSEDPNFLDREIKEGDKALIKFL